MSKGSSIHRSLGAFRPIQWAEDFIHSPHAHPMLVTYGIVGGLSLASLLFWMHGLYSLIPLGFEIALAGVGVVGLAAPRMNLAPGLLLALLTAISLELDRHPLGILRNYSGLTFEDLAMSVSLLVYVCAHCRLAAWRERVDAVPTDARSSWLRRWVLGARSTTPPAPIAPHEVRKGELLEMGAVVTICPLATLLFWSVAPIDARLVTDAQLPAGLAACAVVTLMAFALTGAAVGAVRYLDGRQRAPLEAEADLRQILTQELQGDLGRIGRRLAKMSAHK